jgi:hypothetical protein
MLAGNPVAGVVGALLVPAAGFCFGACVFGGGLLPLAAGFAFLASGAPLLGAFVFGRGSARAELG